MTDPATLCLDCGQRPQRDLRMRCTACLPAYLEKRAAKDSKRRKKAR